MKVSHAPATAVPGTDETAGQAGGEVPGMLEVLALVPDTRKRRGRRFALVFILAVVDPGADRLGGLPVGQVLGTRRVTRA